MLAIPGTLPAINLVAEGRTGIICVPVTSLAEFLSRAHHFKDTKSLAFIGVAYIVVRIIFLAFVGIIIFYFLAVISVADFLEQGTSLLETSNLCHTSLSGSSSWCDTPFFLDLARIWVLSSTAGCAAFGQTICLTICHILGKTNSLELMLRALEWMLRKMEERRTEHMLKAFFLGDCEPSEGEDQRLI